MDPLIMGAGAAVLTAVVAGLGVRRRAKKLERRKPDDPADRALVNLVIALGHDPATTLVRLVRGPRAGMQVLDWHNGRLRKLRFYRLAELERMKRDPEKRHLFEVARAT